MCKKICFLGTTTNSVLLFRLELIKSLINSGFSVHVFTSDLDHSSELILLEHGVIPHKYSLSRSSINPFSFVVSFLNLFYKIRKLQPDILFCYFSKPVILGLLISLFINNVKTIALIEGLGFYFTQQDSVSLKTLFIKKVQSILYKIALPIASEVVFLNKDDVVDLIYKNNINIKSINIISGIGVNLDDYGFTELPQNKTLNFLFIGRLIKEKGINEFLEVAQLVNRNSIRATFTVLGRVEETSPCNVSLDSLNKLSDDCVINFKGYVDNVHDFISKSDVIVLPSYREGLPRSLQEALATGRPVITTDVPGCKECVVDGFNGFLIKPRSVFSLHESVEFFICNPEIIPKFSQNSLSLSKKFCVKSINKKFLSLIGN